MSPAHTVLAVTTLLAALAHLPAAGPPAPLPSEVARWIEELGDDSFAVREAASRKLLAAGARAEEALGRALDSKDPEVVRRAKNILAEFKWGIYPDTPPRVADLIRTYRASARSERRQAIRKMLAEGPDGCRALRKVARAEDDAQVRSEVFREFAAGLPLSFPAYLEEGNTPAVEALLELALASDTREGVLHYTAYHLLTGQLPARVNDWQRRARAAVVPKAENAVLAYFYRALGDWPKARAAAEAAEREDLMEAFRYEQGDWKALAADRRYPQTEEATRYLAYRAAYGRLAGDRKVYEDAVADLLKAARRRAGNRSDVLPFVKALFLNGRAAEAVELLANQEGSARMLCEVLVAQGRVKEALAAVEARRKAGTGDLASLEILEARVLYNLGEKEKALALLTKHAGHADRIEAELALGRRDEAFAQAAALLQGDSDRVASLVFEKLYEKRGPDARVLWRLLQRQAPTDPAERRLARLRSLLEGKAGEKEAKDFLAAARPAAGQAGADERRVLGEVAVLCKLPDLALASFREAATCRALTRAADLLADKKQWPQAAAQYLAAYKAGLEAGPDGRVSDEGEGLPALALWLAGHALAQAGRADEGRRLRERAHLLPLGDGETRFDLAQALRRRGHREAAAREQDLLRRVGEPALSEVRSYFTGEGFRAAALDASARKEFLHAADGYEKAFLRCLQPRMNFARASAYVSVPGYIATLRARGLVAAGRLDEAVEEIERARASLPGGVDLAIQLVPELERHGRKKEADALHGAVVAHHEAVVRDWPKCAWARNQLAWLAACCRRDLEQGLVHARKAVELAPDNAGYHDTLAEVLFQLGRKDEAIAAQKKAIALSPSREYYQKQLRRLQTGDPKAPRPEEED